MTEQSANPKSESDIEKAVRASGLDFEVYNRQHEQSIQRLQREFPEITSNAVRKTYNSMRAEQEKEARLFKLLPEIIYRNAKLYLQNPPKN